MGKADEFMNKESYWIWKYGDFELYHSNKLNCRREQYGACFPVFWKLYDVDRNVKFYRECEIEKDGYLILHVNGKGSVVIDNVRYPSDTEIKLSKGSHAFRIEIFNLSGLPSAYIESDVMVTDGEWYTKDSTDGKFRVGFDKAYNFAAANPEKFNFEYERLDYIHKEEINGGILFDFGRETFGFLNVENVLQSEEIRINYGESREEALDLQWAVVREDISGESRYKLRQRAFRYIYITGSDTAEIYAESEYLPLKYRGSFECSEQTINDIWDMCAYTLKLNAREVFTEAVKRDRWLWGGDAYQIFKFSKYLFFDKEIVRRSLIGLRGKEPFDEHINTITDYSLYWVIALWEYYCTYKDAEFIKFIYRRAVTLMDFCKTRTDRRGFIVGLENDWIFIDWADIDKSGVVCAEQMLYFEALNSMYKLSEVVGETNISYKTDADELKEKINKYFWNDSRGAYVDNCDCEDVKVTRHANIFAIMYNIADGGQKKSIIDNVLNNSDIPAITTPYFEGYELDAMGMSQNYKYIYDKIVSYWKGMMDLGATTVWEEYNPKLSGAEHYAMYGDKFQKSLCHAWGASPIYIFGRYFLGVYETAPGYETFEVKPFPGKFEYMKGVVPILGGEVYVSVTKDKVCVKTNKNGGKLLYGGKEYELEPNEEIEVNRN